MKFRRMAILVFLALAFLPVSGLIQADFSDVSANHPYKEAIEYVDVQGIMNGNGNTFNPNGKMNRAELIKTIVSSRYEKSMIEECIQSYRDRSYWYVYFTDVPTESWYGPYVCVAQQQGIVKGYPDRTLHPSQEVSFVEAAKILLTTLGIAPGEGTPWYAPYVRELESRSAIPTSISSFTSALSRGEFAEITYRLLNDIVNLSSKEYADLTPLESSPCGESAKGCLVIEGLGIQVPIIFGVGNDALDAEDWPKLENQLLTALRQGVVHYPATALPGEKGNVFITGHSSFYATDPGQYKEVFARLPDLEIGDSYKIYYGGKKYVYQIFDEKIVNPEDVHILDQTPVEERSSLMTCWPRYTNQQRKIFTAKRIE